MGPTTFAVFHPRAFRGRVFGVTGGAHGIGEATVRQLLALGARVALLDIDRDHLARVAADLKGHGDDLLPARGDVADLRYLRRSIRAAHRRWGRLDGWVSNAMYNPFNALEEETPESFERAWRVNVVAAWGACQELAPLLRDAKAPGGGAIVHVSSMLAHVLYSHNAAYVASKAAVEGLTRAMAVELGPARIRVNAVVPGMIDTSHPRRRRPRHRPRHLPPEVTDQDIARWREIRGHLREYQCKLMQPWPEGGRPEDVASAILFLLSDAAGYITGACLPVDGGAMIHHPRVQNFPAAEVAQHQQSLRELMEKYRPFMRRSQTRGKSNPTRRHGGKMRRGEEKRKRG